MRQFTLPLKKNTQRPVVVLNEFYDLEVMLDTGALFPVWVEDELLQRMWNLPCYMMMSATMFRHLIYEIDDYNYRFNVSIPETESEVRNLLKWDSDVRLNVACNIAE